MKKFFRTHPETTLIILALLLTAAVIGSFTWGIGNIVSTVNGALTFAPSATKPGYDLQSAAKLDLRGLTPQ